jgi:glyoxylase-like metal-dependent hydrolase (beta-lactamase superfamily II)
VPGALTVPQQLAVEHAIVSHAHLDHVAGLAYLTETLAFCEVGAAVTISGIDPVITALRSGVFNNAIWPDFSKIPHPDVPVVKFRTLIEDVEQRVSDLWITPVGVSHSVPATGFLIHDGSSALIYSGDTGPTEALWQTARGLRGLRADHSRVRVPESARPRSRRWQAHDAGPDPPRARQAAPDVPIWIFHVKPQFHEEIGEELARLDSGRVAILEQDRTYTI